VPLGLRAAESDPVLVPSARGETGPDPDPPSAEAYPLAGASPPASTALSPSIW